ncbi:MAG: CoA-binding protein [Chloroflexi bacterium]|nr:CoA-binding protein [Chloroflexota bacterium]
MITDDTQLRNILTDYKNIVIVGLSPDPFRPSNSVAIYLLDHGYNVIPVNPGVDEVLGLKSYGSLEEIPGEIDIVDVFRRSEHVPDIAHEAAEINAKVLWTQLGVISPEGAAIAETADLKVVMDRCTAIEHRRLVATRTA